VKKFRMNQERKKLWGPAAAEKRGRLKRGRTPAIEGGAIGRTERYRSALD